MVRTLKALALLVIAAIVLSACGKKGPVRPKLLPVPAAPAGFAIEQRGEEFLLSWRIPEINEDGSPVAGLWGFRVERLLYRPGEECPECREDFQLAAEIDLEYLRTASRLGDRIFWRDRNVRPDFGYIYLVLAVTEGGLGLPARQMRPYLPPPPPPRQLTATGHDRMVRLDWRPSRGDIVGYGVYRRRAGEPPSPLPISRPTAEMTFYEDFDVKNGERYLYSVAAVLESQQISIESVPSEEIEAVPQAGK